MGQLDGRGALITGGGRGIGRGISELFAAEGATIAVNYRRDAEPARPRARRHRDDLFHCPSKYSANRAPGLVETDMGVRLARSFTGDRDLADLRSLDASAPFGRVCQPLDVANVVLWLCSVGASYVTGQPIVCDGGG